MNEWLTCRDAARLLQVCVGTVRKLADRGLIIRRDLPHTQFRYHRGSVEALARRWGRLSAGTG